MEKKNNLLRHRIINLSGVGPKIADLMEGKGIRTIEDLIWFLPVRYVDRRFVKNIAELKEGEEVSIIASVSEARSLYFRHSRKKAYEMVVDDGTGKISVKWFRWVKEYLQKICRKGNRLMLHGSVTKFMGKFQMVHPDVVVLEDTDKTPEYRPIVPVYPEIEGIKQGTIRNLIQKAFDDYGIYIKSLIPEEIGQAYGLLSVAEAFESLHFPDCSSAQNHCMQSGNVRSGPIERIILEEYFIFQLLLLMQKAESKKNKGIPLKAGGKCCVEFKKGLPFALTRAQVKVIDEIEKDMGQGIPMNRLLQGDVGSGKTVCAIVAMCVAIDNGCQVAFMAPTEILAEQHYFVVQNVFESMKIPVVLLKGNMGSERRRITEEIRNGKAMVVIGTHALIQDDIFFKNLGLVIIDEQHRFGVIQRRLLKQKGSGITPHTLVMTATPIPRTLSMVIYGDLDVSVIDEIPDNRQKIDTKVFGKDASDKVHMFVRAELEKGRQAYIVYPLVEESDRLDLLDATKMASYIREKIFPEFCVDLLHGRMHTDEKERIMKRFARGETDVLVCTTVIEVGIDVPNATVIVIEHAERFGLSQLHQLRGRVGRGMYPSRCMLLTSETGTALSAKRLAVMKKITDGFRIAEEDMKMRGPGDMMGVRQSGIPVFRVGNIIRDGDIMSKARTMAEKTLQSIKYDEKPDIVRRAGKH